MLLEKVVDLPGQRKSLDWDKRLGVKDNFPVVGSEEHHSLLNNPKPRK